MEKIDKSRIKKEAINILLVTIGCLIGTFSSISIMIPSGLTSGGVTGIARIVQHFIPINFSYLYYIGSAIVLILCAIVLGLGEAKKIVVASIIYPTALLFWEQFDIRLIEGQDMLLATIYCGVFSGLCNGIVLSRGFSSGGSDTIAKMIHIKLAPQIPLSKVLLGVDATIIIASAFVYGRNVALYALVTCLISSKVMDYYMYRITPKIVQVEIITDMSDTIQGYILHTLERGVSRENITGAYTNVRRPKLVVLCSPRESVLIRKYVSQMDPHALITVNAVDGVWGTGFRELETVPKPDSDGKAGSRQ